MANYGVNDEGVAGLKRAATNLSSGADEIKILSNNIEAEADSNHEVLGPHSGELSEAVADIRNEVEGATAPIEVIVQKLTKLATKYEGIIARKLLNNGGKN